jgi:uncharacterized protein with PQ loop repeat
MTPLFEALGMAGIALSVIAYLPQMTHLAKEQCSAGVSIRAWRMWLASSILIGSLAVYRNDYVLIALAASSFGSSAIILFLAHRYWGMRCATHLPVSIDPPSRSRNWITGMSPPSQHQDKPAAERERGGARPAGQHQATAT